MFAADPDLPIFYFDDLGDFLEFASLVRETWPEVWYRGHRRGDFSLEPRVMRSERLLLTEHAVARDFVRRGSNFFRGVSSLEYSRWLFLMQHYGIPTRLLDWTESLAVALYFAFERQESAPPCVWFLNPIELNQLSVGEDAIPHEDATEAVNYCRSAFSLSPTHRAEVGSLPLAVLPHYTDARLVTQRACFTVQGNVPEPLEVQLFDLHRARLSRVLLRAQFTPAGMEKVVRQVSAILPTRSQLFPDVGGLVSELSSFD